MEHDISDQDQHSLHKKIYQGLDMTVVDLYCYISLWERSGSVVECMTQDRGAACSSLTGVTVLCP